MPLYRFKTADKGGKISDNTVEGESKDDAVKRLQRRGLTPIEFLGEGDVAIKSKNFSRGGRFDSIDFTDKLVPLLEAGIPIEKSLAIISESSESETEKKLITDLRHGLHEGKKLSTLIRDRGRMFPNIYSNIVEAGEEAGAMTTVLGSMRKFLIERREMKSFIISASIYPLVLINISIGIILFLLGYVVPKFEKIVAKSQGDMGLNIKILFGASRIVQHYWYFIFVFIALLGILIYYVLTSPKVALVWDKYVLRLPLLGKLS